MEKALTGKFNYPLQIQPSAGESLQTLDKWLKSSPEEWKRLLRQHGALLLRGYPVDDPSVFEQVVLGFTATPGRDYYGTSPRNSVEGTQYVFTASELPPYYPIMQHCEMSFLPGAPSLLFFYCHVEPPYGGETPVCDFRKVYHDLNPQIREEFERKGVMAVRNYSGGKKNAFDLWQLKSWQEIFKTQNREEVEAQCREQEMTYRWGADGSLRLSNVTAAVKTHPETGEKAWFNHTQVFHSAAAPIELRYIHQHQKRYKTLALSWFSSAMVSLRNLRMKPEEQPMNMLFGDGSIIPDAYVEHIEAIIWKHLSVFKWQQGDVLVIDNYSTSHGRLPFEGPRSILVSWS